jgi:hypothetical protein
MRFPSLKAQTPLARAIGCGGQSALPNGKPFGDFEFAWIFSSIFIGSG